ncbi:hypothetical protein EXIGLDRAFT_697697 [Exidia glandulosa HHB12029]|uniref:Uncharacterized protein n=1 Tax=Exidia glandulosa HHB12029 TaxID=1314781 RepID=A0A165MVB9_EXIGL|nr:hypothetical protein EXIGLDRAFT_697697 [Exidia glandulosa HHB12029]
MLSVGRWDTVGPMDRVRKEKERGQATNIQAMLPHAHLGIGVTHGASEPVPGAPANAIDDVDTDTNAAEDGTNTMEDVVHTVDEAAHTTEESLHAAVSVGISASTGTGASTGASE